LASFARDDDEVSDPKSNDKILKLRRIFKDKILAKKDTNSPFAPSNIPSKKQTQSDSLDLANLIEF